MQLTYKHQMDKSGFEQVQFLTAIEQRVCHILLKYYLVSMINLLQCQWLKLLKHQALHVMCSNFTDEYCVITILLFLISHHLKYIVFMSLMILIVWFPALEGGSSKESQLVPVRRASSVTGERISTSKVEDSRCHGDSHHGNTDQQNIEKLRRQVDILILHVRLHEETVFQHCLILVSTFVELSNLYTSEAFFPPQNDFSSISRWKCTRLQ